MRDGQRKAPVLFSAAPSDFACPFLHDLPASWEGLMARIRGRISPAYFCQILPPIQIHLAPFSSNLVSGSHRVLRSRWRGAVSFTGLGRIASPLSSFAHAVSDDGSVTAGSSFNSSFSRRAIRWTGTTLNELPSFGDPNGNIFRQNIAFDVSGDGSVVVGLSDYGQGLAIPGQPLQTGPRGAFRWTSAAGLVDLGTLGGPTSQAYGISGDGSVTVGSAHKPSTFAPPFNREILGDIVPVRWTASGIDTLIPNATSGTARAASGGRLRDRRHIRYSARPRE